jgi:hypothetical protein
MNFVIDFDTNLKIVVRMRGVIRDINIMNYYY